MDFAISNHLGELGVVPMKRREFLLASAGTAAAFLTSKKSTAHEKAFTGKQDLVKKYLHSLRPTKEQVKNFLLTTQGSENLSRNDGWTFDPKLGWVLCDSIRGRSVDGSKGIYRYEADGARKVVNFPDRPCRIHTYGNSFTHCDQVSDGETWQEYLAAHLQEPIRNYGVGGYGVYQAFLRMKKVEKQNPAEYIILNIWDDDHYRNLESWRAIRFGARTPCGYTLPFLKVNIEKNQCREIDNICQQPEKVYLLGDEQFVWENFHDDPVLITSLARRLPEKDITPEMVRAVEESFGFPENSYSNLPPKQRIHKMHTEAALFATKNIVTWTEQFTQKTGKKMILILSFGSGNIHAALADRPRFDQTFVDSLKNKSYPVIDMRDAFKSEFQNYKGDIRQFLKKYYIGHHNPAGNFFFAWAIKNRIVNWLNPIPRPYR
jgi:hypothetical protein